MIRKAALSVILWLAICLPAGAWASPYGTIKGHILDANTGKPHSRVLVTLSGARRDGTDRILTKTRTDASGAYRFGHLPTGRQRYYALDAVYQKGIFAGRAISIPSNTSTPPVIDTTLRVYPTIDDPQAVLVSSDNFFVVPNKHGVGVIEVVRYSNQTDHAYIGRGMGAAGSRATRPTLGMSLPPDTQKRGLRIIRSSLDVPGIVPSDFGFSMTAAIPPGENSITFTYQIPGNGSDFSLNHAALYPTIRYQVYAASPLQINSSLLKKSGTVNIGGASYTTYTSRSPLNAGDEMLATAVAEAGLSIGLMAGIGVAFLALIAAIVMAALKRRRTPARTGKQIHEEPVDARSALVDEIARLDLRYRAGEIERDDYTSRRDELKRRLARSQTLETAP